MATLIAPASQPPPQPQQPRRRSSIFICNQTVTSVGADDNGSDTSSTTRPNHKPVPKYLGNFDRESSSDDEEDGSNDSDGDDDDNGDDESEDDLSEEDESEDSDSDDESFVDDDSDKSDGGECRSPSPLPPPRRPRTVAPQTDVQHRRRQSSPPSAFPKPKPKAHTPSHSGSQAVESGGRNRERLREQLEHGVHSKRPSMPSSSSTCLRRKGAVPTLLPDEEPLYPYVLHSTQFVVSVFCSILICFLSCFSSSDCCAAIKWFRAGASTRVEMLSPLRCFRYLIALHSAIVSHPTPRLCGMRVS
jgi:hypothetical protein